MNAEADVTGSNFSIFYGTATRLNESWTLFAPRFPRINYSIPIDRGECSTL